MTDENKTHASTTATSTNTTATSANSTTNTTATTQTMPPSSLRSESVDSHESPSWSETKGPSTSSEQERAKKTVTDPSKSCEGPSSTNSAAAASVEKKESAPVLKALRDGFGEGLLIAAKENTQIVALSADLTESNRLDKFKKEYPERFVEVGIAEQNLIGVAAGMAHVGKIPFAASFAVFSPGRSWDQIRVSVCYSSANVKVVGGHAGITVGEDGATHEALEDIAIMRVLPRMTILVPADAIEMRKATIAAATFVGPIYLRSGREKLPMATTEDTPFTIGKANTLRSGSDVTIIACGILVHEALVAADELAKQKISARVIDMHTIKPLDVNEVLRAANETGAIVTAEEHQITGGLGSAVCEALCSGAPVPVERVGVTDTFCESGTGSLLMDKYGLRAKDIVSAALRAISRKKKETNGRSTAVTGSNANSKTADKKIATKASTFKVSPALLKKIGKASKVTTRNSKKITTNESSPG